MLLGAALFAATMLSFMLRLILSSRGTYLGVLTPEIERLETPPAEEPALTHSRELFELGFTSLGAWRVDVAPGHPTRRTIRTVLAHTSTDHRIEADVTAFRSISEERAKAVYATTFLGLRSVDATGKLAVTYNFPLKDTLESHPLNSFRRLPTLETARELLVAHRAHLASIDFSPVPLDPTDYERRYLERHCQSMWHLEAQRLARFDGLEVRATVWFGFRQARLALEPAGLERRRGLMLLVLGAIAAAGALGASAVVERLPHELADLAACGLFVLVALACVAAFDLTKVQATGYACLPAAIVFWRGRVDTPWAWAAALITSGLLATVIHRRRFRRVKSRLTRGEPSRHPGRDGSHQGRLDA